MGRTYAAAIVVAGLMVAAPAAAQFGGLFGSGPPRPPGSVPGGRQGPPPQSQDGYDYPPPDNYPPPPANYPPPRDQYGTRDQYGNDRGGPYGNIQSRPLPPPPGSAIPAQREPAQREPAAAAPPVQRRPQGATQPAAAAQQENDEIIPPPSQKIANKGALFSGLDKITGRVINFDVAIGETVQFGALQITPRACYTRPPTEAANTDAFVAVDEVTLKGEIKRIFTGWMFASSPGLHAVEHPIYDIWLTDCKSPIVTAEQPAAEPAPAPAPKQQRRPPQRRTNARPPQQVVPR